MQFLEGSPGPEAPPEGHGMDLDGQEHNGYGPGPGQPYMGDPRDPQYQAHMQAVSFFIASALLCSTITDISCRLLTATTTAAP